MTTRTEDVDTEPDHADSTDRGPAANDPAANDPTENDPAANDLAENDSDRAGADGAGADGAGADGDGAAGSDSDRTGSDRTDVDGAESGGAGPDDADADADSDGSDGDSADGDGSDGDESAEADEARPGRGGRLAIVLVVAAVLVAGAGGWFLLRANEITTHPAVANSALVDTGRTAEVNAAVTSAINQIFSYSYDRTEVTEEAAARLLRGEARASYDRLFARVVELAPEQKLVVTTRVVSAAVQELTADSARVLVFLDQAAIRADSDTSNASAAQLSVTVRRVGEQWVITGLEPR